ncbi:hypothetical protein Pyn_28663 [Prunus yedoensis var. nudiflora]|uniref:Uncharacterized protein n=1 Tax=Prunus yedoensis var. nudiflora TaxID=2094558 RepID=A0A314YX92_PRUYE|nr:hypothetical protein Pyn_28663 [Prunus yedoensis var. nudiflora]
MALTSSLLSPRNNGERIPFCLSIGTHHSARPKCVSADLDTLTIAAASCQHHACFVPRWEVWVNA